MTNSYLRKLENETMFLISAFTFQSCFVSLGMTMYEEGSNLNCRFVINNFAETLYHTV